MLNVFHFYVPFALKAPHRPVIVPFFSSFFNSAMQRLSQTSKFWRTIASKARINVFSINDPFASRSFSAVAVVTATTRKLHQPEIPSDFQKWGSVGFCRTSKFASGFNPLQPKPLDSIVDVHRLKDRYPEDIASVWDDYHIGRGHIGATMKAKLYHLLEHRASECRYFVIPLWRGSGYTTMFVQVQTPHMIFTGLEDYKARGTQAAPYFTVSFYTEFAESKDLILIRGDVVFTSKLTDSEAKWLLEAAQSFYLNDARYKLVERFNRQTHDFEFKDVLQVLDMPIL